MQINRVKIPRWFDRHLHLRDGDMLKLILPCTLKQRATGAVIMPNLIPEPASDFERVTAYWVRIMSAIPKGYDFQPRMTLYLTDHTTPDEVVEGFVKNVWCAVKLYLANQQGRGGTTGSQHGVKDILGRYLVFEAMESKGIPLLIHLEAVEDDVDEFDREITALDRHLVPLLKTFPKLKVVIEHVTDGRVAEFVAETEYNVRATVTAHHLMINRNAMFRGGMNPGHYCRPVPKRERDRTTIRRYVTSGHPSFGAGTDSAPHDEAAKSRCYGCAAGIFTAKTAVELFTTAFDEDDSLPHLGSFLSENFLDWYGMEVGLEMMTVERTPLTVPEKVGSVQVFMGRTVLPWTLVG